MFVKTVKLKHPIFAVTAVLLALAAVIVCVLCAVKTQSKSVYRVKTEQQRQALISQLGWDTADKPTEHKTVTMPDKLDEVYSAYNELQKEQGFDLEKYLGKKVEIYTYPVYNYSGHSDCMTITLIGCDGVLIGGDVCCTELDGFMQGIKKAD